MDQKRSAIQDQSAKVKKLMTYKLTTAHEKAPNLKEQKEAQEKSLERAVDEYRKLCQLQRVDAPVIQQLVELKEAEYLTIAACKTVYMAMRVEKDFSSQQQEFEQAALQSKKRAEVVKLFRREKQLTDTYCKDWLDAQKHNITQLIEDAIDQTEPKASANPIPRMTKSKSYPTTLSTPNITPPNESTYSDKVAEIVIQRLEKEIKKAAQSTINKDTVITDVSTVYSGTREESEKKISKAFKEASNTLKLPSVDPQSNSNLEKAVDALRDKAEDFLTEKIRDTTTLLQHITKTYQPHEHHLLKAEGKGIQALENAIKNLKDYKSAISKNNLENFEKKIKDFYIDIMKGMQSIEIDFVDAKNGFTYNENVKKLFELLDNICGTNSFKKDSPAELDFTPTQHTLHIKSQQGMTKYNVKIKTLTGKTRTTIKFISPDSQSTKTIQEIKPETFLESCFSNALDREFRGLITRHTKAEETHKLAEQKDEVVQDALKQFINHQLKNIVVDKYSSEHQKLLQKAKKKDEKIMAQQKVMLAATAA